jgi:hypothetical protein
MLMNAYIVMGCADVVSAEAIARAELGKQCSDPSQFQKAPLFEPVKLIPASWGYPERCMVTLTPSVRDLKPAD